MSKDDKNKTGGRPPRRGIGDTELEMKAIPFFIDKISPERTPEDTPTITEFSPEALADFDDDDDTVTIFAEGVDVTDATGTLFDDESED